MGNRHSFFIKVALLLCVLFFTTETASYAAPAQQPWRIRFLEVAIITGSMVTLGEVAVPVGEMPPEQWAELAKRELWPAPPEGRAVNMTRPRLQEAVVQTMNDLAPYCLFPGSMALQRGGDVLNKEELQRIVDRELRTQLSHLPGEIIIKDFRLPPYIFLEHSGQTLSVTIPKTATAGRQSLRLAVQEMDGTVKQKYTGSVFVDCWAEVPCASSPLNREDLLDHSRVTFKRMNLAMLRSDPWDGRGGPWRVMRPISVEQVIYQSDLGHVPTVRKGNKLTLLYTGKTVRLTVQVEALADGVAGESIPVRNLHSKKDVYAVVRDASTVIVEAP